VQGDAAFFPALNQSPIDRAEHEMLAATAHEGVFDFGEVAEVIQKKVSSLKFQVQDFPL